MGNITREIELRYTPKGSAVTDLGLAVNRVRLDESGNKIEEVTFVDVTLWGRQAELANQYLSKGRGIFIEGRLHMDTWTDEQTGKQRSRLKVIGENMQFIGGKPQSGDQPPRQQSSQRPSDNLPVGDPVFDDADDADDIPF